MVVATGEAGTRLVSDSPFAMLTTAIHPFRPHIQLKRWRARSQLMSSSKDALVRALSAALFLFFAWTCQASTLDEIAAAVSVRTEIAAIAPSWGAADSIQQIRWLDKKPRQDIPGRYVRYGTLKLDGDEKASILLTGSKLQIYEAEVSILDQKSTAFSPKFVSDLIDRQFPSNVNLTRIESCETGPISGRAVYAVNLAGAKPLLMLVQNDGNGNAPGRVVAIRFTRLYRDEWKCD